MSRKRIDSIDATRGIAIILMVLYHLVFDLNYFLALELNPYSGFWLYEGRISAVLFILISGISTSLLFTTTKKSDQFVKKNIKRSIIILFGAMGVSLASFLIAPKMTIHFGILHFLAISTLLSTILVQLSPSTLAISGITLLTISEKILQIISTPPFKENLAAFVGMRESEWISLPFGLHGPTYTTFDYFPLLPWFGLLLLGLALGKILPQFTILTSIHPPKWLNTIGKKSLAIYLLHQPILLGILFLFAGH